jgi:hypothetical protein
VGDRTDGLGVAEARDEPADRQQQVPAASCRLLLQVQAAEQRRRVIRPECASAHRPSYLSRILHAD